MAQRAKALEYPSGVESHGNTIRISFSYKGKRHRESLGIAINKQNINFAKMKRETILYEIKIGIFNYAQHFPNSKHASGKPGVRTIEYLASEFIKHKAHDVRSSTLQRYEWVMRDFIAIYGKSRGCDTLSPRSLSAFRQELVKNKSARTINRNIVTINSFLKWLMRMEYLDKDLSDNLQRVKESPPDIEPYSLNELSTLLSNCEQLQHRNMITLMVHSGIRSGELCALAWEDIDFENGVMHIRRSTFDKRGLKTTKTDTERYIDLLPPAIEALKAQRHVTYLYPAKEYQVELPAKMNRTERLRFVFNPKAVRRQKNSDYDYYGKRALSRLWEGLCKKSEVKNRSMYQLRHTYASWLITHSNINVSYLAQQMGHSDITMVAKVYGKWLAESNKKESERAWIGLQNAMNE